VYFVEWSALGVVEWVYTFAGESFFYAIVYLFFGEYFRAPLGDQVCGLVVEMSVVLYFYNVVWCVDGFIECHVCVFLVCHSASFRGASPHVRVGGDCIVVGVFDVWEVFLVYVFVPRCMDELC